MSIRQIPITFLPKYGSSWHSDSASNWRIQNKGADFRGSLIDDKMFAIDVAEWGKRNILEEYREKADTIQREKKEAA